MPRLPVEAVEFYEGLTAGGADAALAASVFHYGTYTVEQVKQYLRERGVGPEVLVGICLEPSMEMAAAILMGGATKAAAAREVTATIDRLIYYVGWADKFAQVLGSVNPVAAPYFNFTVT